MSTTKRLLAWVAVELVVCLLLFGVLHAWFAREGVANALFTGGHVPTTTLIGAVLFFAVRLTTYLLLPGVVLAQLAWLLLSVLFPQRSQSS